MTAAEDYEGIRHLLARYCITADLCLYDEWAGLFGDDGVMYAFRRDWVGHDKLVGFISNAPEGIHLNTSLQIELDGDRAAVLSNFVFFNLDMEPGSMGVYEDEVVRTDHGWRFARRAIRIAKPSNPATD